MAFLIITSPVRGQDPVVQLLRADLLHKVDVENADPNQTKPNPAEVATFRHRLSIQLRTWLGWVESSISLTNEQRNLVQARAEELVETESTLYGQKLRLNRLPGFSDEFPYLFTLHSEPLAPRPILTVVMLERRLGGEVFTGQQMAQLTAAGRDHVQFRRGAFRDFILARLDRSLQLTDLQLEDLKSKLAAVDSNLDVPFFNIRGSSHLPTRKALSLLPATALNSLSPDQRLALGQEDPALAPVIQLSANSLTRWPDEVERLSEQVRAAVYRYYLADIEDLEHRRDVTPDAGLQIRFAAKGAAVDAADDWRTAAIPEAESLSLILQTRLRLPAVSRYGLTRVSFDQVKLNPRWVAARQALVETSAPREAVVDRQGLWHAARAGAVLAMLDQELWLTGQQREQLLPIIIRVLDQHQPQSPDDENLSLLGDLALPLHRISPTDREAILSSTQQEVWNVLTASFEFQAGQSTVLANSRGPTEILEWKWRVVAEDQ